MALSRQEKHWVLVNSNANLLAMKREIEVELSYRLSVVERAYQQTLQLGEENRQCK